MEQLYMVLTILLLTLILVVFAVNPLQAAIEEGVRNHAQLQAQRFASIINLMETAPDGTRYEFDMPTEKCKVTITDSFIKLTITPVAGQDIFHVVSLTKTSVPVTKGEFECRANRNIEMIKNNGVLEIRFR